MLLLVGFLAEYWNWDDQVASLRERLQRDEGREDASRRLPRRSRQLADDEVDRLVAARKAGAEIKDLAAELGVHRATIIAHLNRRGVEGRRHPGRTLTETGIQDAGRLYESGLSLAEVGKRLDVDRRYLRVVLPAAGFPLRRPGRQQSR